MSPVNLLKIFSLMGGFIKEIFVEMKIFQVLNFGVQYFSLDTISPESSIQEEDSYLFRKDVYRRSQFQHLNTAKSLLLKAGIFQQIFPMFAAAASGKLLYQ